MFTDISAVAGSSGAAATMKKEAGLNKEDFLKMFVTQLRNQDPLNPQDSTQFLAQLAQLTQVEQSYNTNTNLTNLLAATQNSTDLSLLTFIGKAVLSTGNQVTLTADMPQRLNFNLPSDASSLSVQIKSASGQVVRTLTQNDATAGNGSVLWDGKDDSGASLPSGTFNFAVTGTKGDGTAITGTSLITSVVDGVKFDSNGKSQLTSGGMGITPQNVVLVSG